MKYYDSDSLDRLKEENFYIRQFTKNDITRVCELIDKAKASLLTCDERYIVWYLDLVKTYEILLNNFILEV